MDKKHGP